jgi:hypothetical protein
MWIYLERTMLFVAERFITSLRNTYDKHPFSIDCRTRYPPQARKFLKLKYRLHSPF